MIRVESIRVGIGGKKIVPQKVTMTRKEYEQLKEAYRRRTSCTRTLYYKIAEENKITKTEAFQVLMAVEYYDSKVEYPVKLEIKEEE